MRLLLVLCLLGLVAGRIEEMVNPDDGFGGGAGGTYIDQPVQELPYLDPNAGLSPDAGSLQPAPDDLSQVVPRDSSGIAQPNAVANPDASIDDGGGGGGGGGEQYQTVGPLVPEPLDPPTDPTTELPLLTLAPQLPTDPTTDPPTDPTTELPVLTPAPQLPTDTPAQTNPPVGQTDTPVGQTDTPVVTNTPTTEAPTETSTAPTTTTEAPTTTTEYMGRCGPYTSSDGVQYENRCVTKDSKAVCSMDTSQPYCTCTAGWTDTYCAVDTAAFGNLGGNSSGQLIDVINVGKSSPARLISSLPALLSFLTDEQRVAMSYTQDEMIVDATFEEKPLNVRDSFTLFNDPSLGNCFTFNHFNGSLYKARGPGPRYGLRVTLEFKVEEYVPWVEAVGVFTYIHPIGQNIYLESVKHTIQPGSADQISMKKYRFTRIHDMFAKCAASSNAAQSFYFPGDYSVDGCLRSCYQDSVFRSCNCMDPSYARKQGVKACSFEQLECIDEMSARRGDTYYWKECKCPLPCKEEEYRYETSKAMRIQSLSSNTTRTSDIVIFLNTLDVYSQVEEWTFPFSRVLGLTGGFAGVLLGASVVVVVEILVLFLRVGLISCRRLDALSMRKQPEREY